PPAQPRARVRWRARHRSAAAHRWDGPARAADRGRHSRIRPPIRSWQAPDSSTSSTVRYRSPPRRGGPDGSRSLQSCLHRLTEAPARAPSPFGSLLASLLYSPYVIASTVIQFVDPHPADVFFAPLVPPSRSPRYAAFPFFTCVHKCRLRNPFHVFWVTGVNSKAV